MFYNAKIDIENKEITTEEYANLADYITNGEQPVVSYLQLYKVADDSGYMYLRKANMRKDIDIK